MWEETPREQSLAMQVRSELYYDLAIGNMASASGITVYGDW